MTSITCVATRRPIVTVVVVVALGLLAACSSTTTGGEADSSATPPAERVVALGEEFVLADLLALGIRPVASTATVADAGFQGIDPADTAGIEALPATEPNLERLAALAADRIVATQFVVDEVGRDALTGTGADLVVLPDGGSAEAQVLALGDAFDRRPQAEQLVEQLLDARETARDATVDGCTVSMATIYPGPSVAAWVGGSTAFVSVVDDVGCTLVPGAGTAGADANGRVYLSFEQLGQLAAPRLVLLQNEAVEGEAEARTAIEADPLWQQLPAVQTGAVEQVDRLGYPGIEGRIRLYQQMAGFLSEAA